MKTTQTTLAALLLATAVTPAMADVTITPMATYHIFDNKKELDDSVGFAASLGYRLNEKLALELHHGQTKADATDGSGSLTDKRTSLDYRYTFSSSSPLRPFALLGVGRESADGQSAGIINAAVGAFYALNDTLSLRAEVREVYNTDIETSDQVIGLGLQLALGDIAASRPNNAKSAANNVNAAAGEKILTEAISKKLSINFDTGSTVIKASDKAEVASIAALLKQFGSATVEIQGHTDNQGDKAGNDKISQGRADAVKAMLVKNYGIAADRITAKGYGASQPVADNATAEGRAQNRRVMAIIAGEMTKVLKK